MNQTTVGSGLLCISLALLVSSIWIPEKVKDVWNNAFYTFMSSGLAVLSPDLNPLKRSAPGRKQPPKGPSV
jgi:hypothetical protein